MKKICLFILLFGAAQSVFSQEVINSKGTRVFIDSSKWALSGNNIYSKRSGNVGIGVIDPSAKLHTNGTLRFEGLPTSTANTNVLTTDASGNVSVQTISAASGALDSVKAVTPDAVLTDAGEAIIQNTTAYWNANQLQGKNISTTAPTTGQLLQWNGTAWTPYTPDAGYAKLSSNFTTNSTTATNSNLRFAIGANESYYVVIEGTASKTGATTGMKMAIGAPTGSTISGEAYLGGNSLSTAPTVSLISSINSLGNTFATGNNVQVAFRMTFQVNSSSTSGFITLQGATVSGNNATIYAGTRMSWYKVTSL